MPRKLAGFVLAVCITVAPCVAQTTTELLQKGIFAQETEGNLDTAILIYRQIVNSAPAQRDLAAQAQFRLGQALLQKGDLTTAAQEFDKLARDYADYRNLVSTLSAESSAKPVPGFARVYVLSGYAFDESKPVKVTGKVVRLTLLSPSGSITVDDGTTRFLFVTAGAIDMMRQQGFSKGTLKLGDSVEVTGVLSVGPQVQDGATAARADVISADGKIVFERAALKEWTTAPSADEAIADLQKRNLSGLSLAITQLTAHLSELRTHYTDSNPDVMKTMKRLADLQDQVKALKAEMAASGKF